MPDDMQSYELAAIRDMLLAALTTDDLRRLVLYTSRPALKPLIHELSPGDGLAAMTEKTITYCHKQDCLGDLLAEVKKANPRQYARFESQLALGDDADQAALPAAAPAGTATRGATYVTHVQHADSIAIGNGARVIKRGDKPDSEPAG